MEIEVWQIWVIVAILLFIIEVFTAGFLTAALAIGCLAAAVCSFLDFSTTTQLFFFSVGSLIGFFGVRPFMMKYAYKKADKIKTNADAIIGKVGKVIEKIDNHNNQGRIIVDGDDWRAETEHDEIVEINEKVTVLEVNSTILIVKPLN